ncbi:MAG: class I SAM-dependent methyltransferase [Phycisphaerales bacterium]|nr:class I SAM-dependent methyltransferase [Phycisphaerales bacterium]
MSLRNDAAIGDRDWTSYYAAVAGKPPRDTLVMATEKFAHEGRKPGRAIDLGCGEGRDTRELLRRGWSVLAIDPHPAGLARLRESLAELPALPPPHESCRIVQASLEDAASGRAGIAGSFDLVNASFVLPFVPPDNFGGVWEWTCSLLGEKESGGRFAGQFFGPRDSWASIPGRSHHSRAEVEHMLAGLEVEHFQEDEKDGVDAEGNEKHWHVFHVVARRTGSVFLPRSVLF